MKITQKNLLDIIKEEIKNVLEQNTFDCSALRSSEVEYVHDKKSNLMKATIKVNGKEYTGMAKIRRYNFDMAMNSAAGKARTKACRDLNSGEK